MSVSPVATLKLIGVGHVGTTVAAAGSEKPGNGDADGRWLRQLIRDSPCSGHNPAHPTTSVRTDGFASCRRRAVLIFSAVCMGVLVEGVPRGKLLEE